MKKVNPEPTSRKEKIGLLRQLEQGKISLKELRPEPCTVWIQRGNQYQREGSELILGEEEFQKHRDENRIIVEIILPDNGRRRNIKA